MSDEGFHFVGIIQSVEYPSVGDPPKDKIKIKIIGHGPNAADTGRYPRTMSGWLHDTEGAPHSYVEMIETAARTREPLEIMGFVSQGQGQRGPTSYWNISGADWWPSPDPAEGGSVEASGSDWSQSPGSAPVSDSPGPQPTSGSPRPGLVVSLDLHDAMIALHLALDDLQRVVEPPTDRVVWLKNRARQYIEVAKDVIK